MVKLTIEEKEILAEAMRSDSWKLVQVILADLQDSYEGRVLKEPLVDTESPQKLAYVKARAEGSRLLINDLESFRKKLTKDNNL